MIWQVPRKYFRKDGSLTNADDPQRLVWAGMCTYWTDDWSTLVDRMGWPSCPHCGAPGTRGVAEEWFRSAEAFQAHGNPDYVQFLMQSAEQCKGPLTFLQWYRQYLSANPNNARSDGT